MGYRNCCFWGAVVWLVWTSSLAAQSGPVSPQTATSSPHFPTPAEVDKAISEYLANLTNRQEDDLLSRRDIVPLFAELEHLGWELTDKAQIEKRLLPDSDWLVRTLRTKKGAQFMRDMSSFPGGYDRLDRMQQQPYGKRELQGLIDSPGGAELIDYLTNTKQGRRTGSQLTGPHGGGAFNTPTGRLYTKADVFKQFRSSYAADAARRLEATAVPPSQPNPPPSAVPSPLP